MSAASHERPGGEPFDVERVRADFPILKQTMRGKPLVFLDTAASSQKPQVVIDAMSDFYASEYANIHRGLYQLSSQATRRFEDVRGMVQRFIHASDVREIVFVRNATEAINLVAYSWGRRNVGKGDEILISAMEHHANIVPWQLLCEEVGATLRVVPITDAGELEPGAFESLLSDRTRLVAMTHVSNALGTVVPIKEVIALAHAHGVPVLVDGSQAAPHMVVDVQDLDADFYAFTGHKVYGPTGIGVLWARRKHLDAMPPFLGGGEMIRDVLEDKVTYEEPPQRFEAGTPPIVQAIGLGAALNYMQSIGHEAIAAHEADLRDYAHERLSALNSIRIFGEAPGKGAIVSFEMHGAHSHDVSTIIDREGVAVRAGTHCAQPLLARYGVTSTCRASFGLYNTKAEIDTLAEALIKAHSFFA